METERLKEALLNALQEQGCQITVLTERFVEKPLTRWIINNGDISCDPEKLVESFAAEIKELEEIARGWRANAESYRPRPDHAFIFEDGFIVDVVKREDHK